MCALRFKLLQLRKWIKRSGRNASFMPIKSKLIDLDDVIKFELPLDWLALLRDPESETVLEVTLLQALFVSL